MHPDCKEMRETILRVSLNSGHGHIPTCFSVVEMLYAVYSVMRHMPQQPDWPDRDVFILSKGHAALGFYSVLARFGYFSSEAVNKFGSFESAFGCHPDRLKLPGVELSTGSLGHGIGVAVGVALAFQLQASERRVYTLIGDGESNEGSVWEALMVASHLKLNNLTVMLDYNQSQRRAMPLLRPADKFRAFDCEVLEVDGHDVEALQQALRHETNQVKAVVAHTIKGYGCRTIVENVFEWHRKSPTAEQYEAMLKELHA